MLSQSLTFIAMNRIDRLTAILIQLQTKRVITASEIAGRFSITSRTVYRDIKALMEAGVPIGSEAGKGYFLVDGYHLPPVMLTQDEASSVLLAGKLVEKMTDKSVRTAFDSVLNKIKAILNEQQKDHLENLDAHIAVGITRGQESAGTEPDGFMTDVQGAAVNKQVLQITYTNNLGEQSRREVEPIGIFYYSMAWHLIGWCRLRNGYRDFRISRIQELINTGAKFGGRNLISLKEYLQSIHNTGNDLTRVVITFDKTTLRGQPVYGTVSQTDLGDKLKAEFLADNLDKMAHWLLVYGPSLHVEEPEELKVRMTELAEKLYRHYVREGHFSTAS